MAGLLQLLLGPQVGGVTARLLAAVRGPTHIKGLVFISYPDPKLLITDPEPDLRKENQENRIRSLPQTKDGEQTL